MAPRTRLPAAIKPFPSRPIGRRARLSAPSVALSFSPVVSITRRVLGNPGVLFALANVTAFLQSDSRPAVVAAFGSAAITILAQLAQAQPGGSLDRLGRHLGAGLPGFVRRQFASALRLNGWTLLAPTLAVAVTSHRVLPIGAGLAFSAGALVASSARCLALQSRPGVRPWVRVITHPTLYWGFGYAFLGLLGGGNNLQTWVGIAVTAVSVIGLLGHRFGWPATPYVLLVYASALNALNAAVHGNAWGCLNMVLGGLGQWVIAHGLAAPGEGVPAGRPRFGDAFFRALDAVNWPRRPLRKPVRD